MYLVQLIEHPILRIPNILFVFPDKSFKLISKYTQKMPIYVTRYIKKTTLQHLKLGKLKFGLRKIGCSMSWTRYYIFPPKKLYIFPKKFLYFCNSRCGPMHDRSQAVQEHEKRSHDWYSLWLLFCCIPVFCPKCRRIRIYDFWRLFWQHSLVVDCFIWGHWCCLLLWIKNVSFNIQSEHPKVSYLVFV